MNEKIISNNIQNDEFTLDNDEFDYEDLITRLNEISEIIALLKKNI